MSDMTLRNNKTVKKAEKVKQTETKAASRAFEQLTDVLAFTLESSSQFTDEQRHVLLQVAEQLSPSARTASSASADTKPSGGGGKRKAVDTDNLSVSSDSTSGLRRLDKAALFANTENLAASPDKHLSTSSAQHETASSTAATVSSTPTNLLTPTAASRQQKKTRSSATDHTQQKSSRLNTRSIEDKKPQSTKSKRTNERHAPNAERSESNAERSESNAERSESNAEQSEYNFNPNAPRSRTSSKDSIPPLTDDSDSSDDDNDDNDDDDDNAYDINFPPLSSNVTAMPAPKSTDNTRVIEGRNTAQTLADCKQPGKRGFEVLSIDSDDDSDDDEDDDDEDNNVNDGTEDIDDQELAAVASAILTELTAATTTTTTDNNDDPRDRNSPMSPLYDPVNLDVDFHAARMFAHFDHWATAIISYIDASANEELLLWILRIDWELMENFVRALGIAFNNLHLPADGEALLPGPIDDRAIAWTLTIILFRRDSRPYTFSTIHFLDPLHQRLPMPVPYMIADMPLGPMHNPGPMPHVAPLSIPLPIRMPFPQPTDNPQTYPSMTRYWQSAKPNLPPPRAASHDSVQFLTSRQDTLEHQVVFQAGSIKHLQETTRMLDRTVRILVRTNQELRMELVQAQQDLSKVRSLTDMTATDFQFFKDNLEEATSNNADDIKRLEDDTKDDLTEARDQLSGMISKLQDDIGTLTTDIQTLEDEDTELRDTLGATARDVEEYKLDYFTLNNQYIAVKEELELINDLQRSLLHRTHALETDNAERIREQTTAAKTAAEATAAAAEARAAAAEARAAAAEERATAATTAAAAAEERAAAAANRNSEAHDNRPAAPFTPAAAPAAAAAAATAAPPPNKKAESNDNRPAAPSTPAAAAAFAQSHQSAFSSTPQMGNTSGSGNNGRRQQTNQPPTPASMYTPSQASQQSSSHSLHDPKMNQTRFKLARDFAEQHPFTDMASTDINTIITFTVNLWTAVEFFKEQCQQTIPDIEPIYPLHMSQSQWKEFKNTYRTLYNRDLDQTTLTFQDLASIVGYLKAPRQPTVALELFEAVAKQKSTSSFTQQPTPQKSICLLVKEQLESSVEHVQLLNKLSFVIFFHFIDRPGYVPQSQPQVAASVQSRLAYLHIVEQSFVQPSAMTRYVNSCFRNDTNNLFASYYHQTGVQHLPQSHDFDSSDHLSFRNYATFLNLLETSIRLFGISKVNQSESDTSFTSLHLSKPTSTSSLRAVQPATIEPIDQSLAGFGVSGSDIPAARKTFDRQVAFNSNKPPLPYPYPYKPATHTSHSRGQSPTPSGPLRQQWYDRSRQSPFYDDYDRSRSRSRDRDNSRDRDRSPARFESRDKYQDRERSPARTDSRNYRQPPYLSDSRDRGRSPGFSNFRDRGRSPGRNTSSNRGRSPSPYSSHDQNRSTLRHDDTFHRDGHQTTRVHLLNDVDTDEDIESIHETDSDDAEEDFSPLTQEPATSNE